MKISKKKLLAIALSVAMVFSVYSIFPLGATEYISDDYCWIEGVLHNDTYALYPYNTESLDIGFSKYGEMIGYNEATGIGVGLQYPGYASAGDTYDQEDGTSVDPFADENIDVDVWLNGWFIDIKYKKAPGDYREIWAFALFSDGSLHGGDWITMPEVDWDSSTRPLWQEHEPYANPDSDDYPSPKPSYGGRKTNGICTTDPIQIIYNGPRKLVALLKTRVKDGGTKLVDLYFTIIFNKAEKNVIVLKDVKRLYDKGPLNIQFGNRGEWDLSLPSYVHFYTDEPVQFWNLPPYTDELGADINATEIADTFEFFRSYMEAEKYPKKWWDKVPENDKPATIKGVAIPDEYYETQYTCYGDDWHMDETIKDHSYAVAQVIDADAEYVGALAVWPHPEFWSVQNSYPNPGHIPSEIPLMLRPLSRMLDWHKWTVDEDPTQAGDNDIADRDDIWVKQDDMDSEPSVPFIIYEHDFELELGVMDEYRLVSVYVLTDYHDADDADASDLDGDGEVENKIDREIQYQLDEIFDPWDIYDAMHKNTKRWVQFFDTNIGGFEWDGEEYYCIQLDDTREVESGKLIPTLPVYCGGEWDAYSVFSERVMVDTGTGYELIYPVDYNWLDPVPNLYSSYYTIDLTTGVICFWHYDSGYKHWYLPEDSVVKVLWSSEHHATTAEQWNETDLLYPIDGSHYIFPLHHDIIDAYKSDTEVFLIEQSPTRISNGTGMPHYDFYPNATNGWARLNVTYASALNGTEIDVKYWNETTGWHEEKFVWQNYTWCDVGLGEDNVTVTENCATFNLTYAASYVEKVWYHSEKALLDGHYVCNNATGCWTVYMQDPVAAGQWLLVNFTYAGGTGLENWFLGDGKTTEFVLADVDGDCLGDSVDPDVGNLTVYNTEILQQILPHNSTEDKPAGTKCEAPDPEFANLPLYQALNDTGAWPNRYGWYDQANEIKWEEREWINVTDTKVRGNWIIHESCTGDYFSTCDELVLDQAPLNSTQTNNQGQELKIVFKVPSGRYEWGVVGKTAASVDSLGNTMIVAAFKNKLIEFGIGGLDIQASDYGPRIPWMVTEDSPDSLGRNHLYDDWCSYYKTVPTNSWPISSSNMITVGGTAVNGVTEYFNDFAQALVGTTIGDGFYPVTCWDKALSGRSDGSGVVSPDIPSGFYDGGLVTDCFGYAVISTYKDKNGTIGFIVHGWTGQDTYYAAKWFDQYKYELQHINFHVTDLILRITYKSATGTLYCPPSVSIVETLGTISEKNQHDC